MTDTLDDAISQTTEAVLTRRMAHLLATEFIRGLARHHLTSIMAALGGVPDWRYSSMSTEQRAEAATSLTDKLNALHQAMYADPDQHPGMILNLLVNTMVMDVIALAAESCGVKFLGETWRILADGKRIQLFEGEQLLFEYPESDPGPQIATPKRGIIVPGR